MIESANKKPSDLSLLPGQFFSGLAVIYPTICCHRLSSRLFSINFFLRSSRIRVDLLSLESKPTEKREQYNWRAKKIFDGLYDWIAEKYLNGYLDTPTLPYDFSPSKDSVTGHHLYAISERALNLLLAVPKTDLSKPDRQTDRQTDIHTYIRTQRQTENPYHTISTSRKDFYNGFLHLFGIILLAYHGST